MEMTKTLLTFSTGTSIKYEFGDLPVNADSCKKTRRCIFVYIAHERDDHASDNAKLPFGRHHGDGKRPC